MDVEAPTFLRAQTEGVRRMLDLEIARVARGVVWRLTGDVTSSTASVLRAAPAAVLDGVVDVDVSGVSAVDKAGLGALVALVLHARRLGATCHLLGATPAFAALLRAEGLDRLLGLERAGR